MVWMEVDVEEGLQSSCRASALSYSQQEEDAISPHSPSLLGVCKAYRGSVPSLSPCPPEVLLAQRGKFSVAVVSSR